VEMMMQILHGERVQTRRLQAELLERESTAAPRANPILTGGGTSSIHS
jgi:hypothetical protein